MINSKSNSNGRALEYCLVREFLKFYNDILICDNKTKNDQVRDQEKFNSLSGDYQNYYINQCQKIVRWVSQNRVYSVNGQITLRRLSDDIAKEGDVTDIALFQNNIVYNISLKHNHFATKHQRPGGLYKQLGIYDKEIDKIYKAKIKEIENLFFSEIYGETFLTFEEVKSYNPNLINNLYRNICNLVVQEINCNANNFTTVELFKFLIGSKDYDKFIVTNQEVMLYSFYNILYPNTMYAYTISNKINYIYLKFDNDYEFALRIHTASSKFRIGKSISLKFDSQLENEPVKPVMI